MNLCFILHARFGGRGGGGAFLGILHVTLKFEILIFSERGAGPPKFRTRSKHIRYL